MEYAKKGYDVEYIDVKASAANLEWMLKVSGGSRNVPVILEDGVIVIRPGGT